MIRWWRVWRLRRMLDRLQGEGDWLRDAIWTHQTRLSAIEARARAVQAELWIEESPRSLLPRRADSGLSMEGDL